MVIPEKAAPVTHVIPEKVAPVTGTTLRTTYWPCAGGLSAVNAIGTQLCDLMYSGLTRWRLAVIGKNEQVGEGRDGRTRLARQNSQARTGTGKHSFSLFS